MVPTIKSLLSIVIVGCISVNAFSIHSVSKRQAETNGDTIEIFPIEQDAQPIETALENDSDVYEIEPISTPTGSQEEIDDLNLENGDIMVDSDELKLLEELDQDIILENVDSGLDIEQPQETIEDGSQETVDEVSENEDSENQVTGQTLTSVWGEEEIAQLIQDETTQESIEEQTTDEAVSDIQSVNESSDESSESETDSGEVVQDTLQELSEDVEKIPTETVASATLVEEIIPEEDSLESSELIETVSDTETTTEEESQLVEEPAVSEIQEVGQDTLQSLYDDVEEISTGNLVSTVLIEEIIPEEKSLESLEILETAPDTENITEEESELVEQQAVSEIQQEITGTTEEETQEGPSEPLKSIPAVMDYEPISSEDLTNGITNSEVIDTTVTSTESTEDESTLEQPVESVNTVESLDQILPEQTESEDNAQTVTEENTEEIAENSAVESPETTENIIVEEQIQDQQLSLPSENLIVDEQILENEEDIMVINEELKELEQLDQDIIVKEDESETQTTQEESTESNLDELTSQAVADTTEQVDVSSQVEIQDIVIPETIEEETISETTNGQLQNDEKFTQESSQDLIEDETYHFLEDVETDQPADEYTVDSKDEFEINNIISESINNLLDNAASQRLTNEIEQEIENHIIPLTEVQNIIEEPETIQQLQHHTPQQMTFDFLANADSVNFDTSFPRHPIRSFTLTIPSFDCEKNGLPNLQLIEDRLTNKFIELGLVSATQDIFTISDAQCGSLIITFEVIEPQEIDAKELIEENLTQAVRAIVNDPTYEHQAFLSEYQPSTINKMAFGLQSKIKLVKILIMEAMSSRRVGDALTLMYLQDRYENGFDGQKEEMLLVMFLLNKKY